MLLFVIGALIAYSKYDPAIRTPVLSAAAIEKFAVGVLIFFGYAKRTKAMVTAAIADGVFAALYVVYLAGL
ncbi:MAG: hypothetical protein ACXWNK_16355 [Vulcanimicrobiaceae bacterium]